ncbi:MAG: hypothetical protein QM582_09585 [Micropruina sp.]|uniref:hypothetical protein n=1 Tax=Micropruina sp. TaxID=2737536 RepID=UPI0039E2860D
MVEVVAAAIATVSTSAATFVAALAYYRAQGFPMIEAIRLARELRRWLKDCRDGEASAWEALPDDLRVDLDQLASRRMAGVRERWS